jgi:DNA (cytosine-5)-methyltransferase 1
MHAPVLLDLFCGCGGMGLGAARAGFDVVAGIDIDAHALAAHERNFPNSLHFALDLSRTSGSAIRALSNTTVGQIDVVAGGPPCQGFSAIGKQNVLDDRNGLISHFLRLVCEIKPRAFVLENVPGILDPRFNATLHGALGSAAAAYNILPSHLISALDAGAPTTRRRVFFVGFLRSIAVPTDFWGATVSLECVPVVRHALDGLPSKICSNWRRSRDGKRVVRVSRRGPFYDAARSRVPKGVGEPASLEAYFSHSQVKGCIGTLHSPEQQERYAALGYGEADSATKSVRLDPAGYCPTLRAGTGPDRGSFQAVRPIHHYEPRVITPREAARLQGFPDWFQFDQTKWHAFRQIGNSISPLVSEYVLTRVAGVLHAER